MTSQERRKIERAVEHLESALEELKPPEDCPWEGAAEDVDAALDLLRQLAE